MAEMRHEITINAPAKQVYDAITTESGLRQWWTADVSVHGPILPDGCCLAIPAAWARNRQSRRSYGIPSPLLPKPRCSSFINASNNALLSSNNKSPIFSSASTKIPRTPPSRRPPTRPPSNARRPKLLRARNAAANPGIYVANERSLSPRWSTNSSPASAVVVRPR